MCRSIRAKYTLNAREYIKLLPTCSSILVKLNRATNTLHESYSHKWYIMQEYLDTVLHVSKYNSKIHGWIEPQIRCTNRIATNTVFESQRRLNTLLESRQVRCLVIWYPGVPNHLVIWYPGVSNYLVYQITVTPDSPGQSRIFRICPGSRCVTKFTPIHVDY